MAYAPGPQNASGGQESNMPAAATGSAQELVPPTSTSLHRASQRANSWETGQTGSANLYPQSPQKQTTWKPATLKTPFLASIAIGLLLWIGVLEYLSQISLRDGGLVFAASQNDFTGATIFLTAYFPTIVAITLSIVWSWVDLDAKRLEPYFQMSQPQGASTADSVLLYYPFDYVAVVPVKALWRRHWSVSFAGTVTAIIFWGLAPLQSALFNTTTLSQTLPTTGNLEGGLASITERAPALNTSFMLKAYNVVWLNQSLPPFTTMDAAYVPFSLQGDPSGTHNNKTFTAITPMLSTSLQCSSATLQNVSSFQSSSSNHSGSGSQYSFDGHFGCKVDATSVPCRDDEYCLWYVGYQTNIGDSLQVQGCSANASNLYLAVMTRSDFAQATAEFCQTSYWIQDVNLTVAEPDMTVVSSVPLGLPRKLDFDDFDATAFQAIIWTDRPQGSMWNMLTTRGDIIDKQSQVDMSGRLHLLDPRLKGSIMAGYAIGLTQLSADAYLKRENLISSLEKAHRVLFALAMNQILADFGNSSTPIQLSVSAQVFAVSILRPLAIAVEALLACTFVCVLSLLLISRKRPSHLTKDPASLTDIASMVESAEAHSESSGFPSIIMTDSNGVRFSLELSRHRRQSPHLTYRRVNQPCRPPGGLVFSKVFQHRFCLSPVAGFIFVVFLLGLIGALVSLKMMIDRNGGLSFPSSSTTITKIIINYFPVIISTFLEPYWTLLNRMLCLLQPFKKLKTCHTKAENSLDLRYSSLPPPLVLWRALRARHVFLAGVCTITVIANVLTVGLGALFNTRVAFPETNVILKTKHKPIFNSTNPVPSLGAAESRDFLYVAQSNLSANTSLPVWTSQEAYFVPVVLDGIPAGDVTLTTPGFSVALACQEVRVRNESFQADMGNLSFNTTVSGAGGSLVDCYYNQLSILPPQDDALEGRKGFEAVAPLLASHPNASVDDTATCSSVLSLIYQRGDRRFNQFEPTSSLYLICRPALEIADYSVRLSRTGYVLSSERQSAPSSNVPEYFPAPYDVSDLYVHLNELIAWVQIEAGNSHRSTAYIDQYSSLTTLHNDSFAYNWFPYLVSQLLRSRDTVNTSLPAPSATTLIPAVSELYSRLAALIFSLFSDTFFPFAASENTTIVASVQSTETRIFMSTAMFYMCGFILLLDVMVALAYYWHQPQQEMPHMPTNVASLMYLFEGSSLATARGRWDPTWVFGFGKFIGTDRTLRVGIERQPYVHQLPKVLAPRDLEHLTGWDIDEGSLARDNRSGSTVGSGSAHVQPGADEVSQFEGGQDRGSQDGGSQGGGSQGGGSQGGGSQGGGSQGGGSQGGGGQLGRNLGGENQDEGSQEDDHEAEQGEDGVDQDQPNETRGAVIEGTEYNQPERAEIEQATTTRTTRM